MARNWIEGVYRNYALAKADLAKEPSEKNFREMIAICHTIIEYYWPEAKNMDEFADLVQNYEKTVVAFWKKYKTLESLYHVVYFYGDWMFTAWIYGLRQPARSLEHMKKGVLYAQLYHEKVNRDYSAVLFIRLYRALCEILPGEGLDYIRTARNMAKEWAHQFRTPFLLNECLSVYYAASRAVKETRWKNEKERQAVEEEFKAFLEDYRAVEKEVCFFPLESQKETFSGEWKLYEKMDHMRRKALSDGEQLFALYRKEIYSCIRICMHLQQTAHDKGLKPLLLEGKKLERSGKIYCRLLVYGIEIIGNVECYNNIAEQMMNQFGGEIEDAYTGYMVYLCTRFLDMMYKGEHKRVVQPFLLSCVPPKERGALLKYLEYQTV